MNDEPAALWEQSLQGPENAKPYGNNQDVLFRAMCQAADDWASGEASGETLHSTVVDYSDAVQVAAQQQQLSEGRHIRTTIYLLSYSHKHGTDITVYATEESANAAKAEIARGYWADAAGSVNAPDDFPASADDLSDAAAVSLYFEVMSDTESVSTTAAEVQP